MRSRVVAQFLAVATVATAALVASVLITYFVVRKPASHAARSITGQSDALTLLRTDAAYMTIPAGAALADDTSLCDSGQLAAERTLRSTTNGAQTKARYEATLLRSGWTLKLPNRYQRALDDREFVITVTGPDSAGDVHISASVDAAALAPLLVAC